MCFGYSFDVRLSYLTLKQSIMKHIIYTLLVISTLQLNAQNYSGGYGTPTKPFIIETYDDLVELSNSSYHWQHYFVQTADIDASDSKFLNVGDHDNDPATPDEAMGLTPIGNINVNFTGHYDGKGHTISNLLINRPATEYVGLFGYVMNAEITAINISYCTISGKKWVAGLIGYNVYTNLNNLFVNNGKVICEEYGVGLLVGNNYQSDIDNCYTTGSVYGYRVSGGLIGQSLYPSNITNSYSAANVFSYSESGGLIGRVDSGNIYNCFATGKVDNDHTDVGGLIGDLSNSTINKCYASGDVFGFGRIGGFVGHSMTNNNIQNSFCSGNVKGELGYTGGFAGKNTESTILNCYSTGSVQSEISAAFCAGNDDLSTIENCYASGFVFGRTENERCFIYTNGINAEVINCYFDLEKTLIGTTNEAILHNNNPNNQSIFRLTTEQFKNKFNFHANWNIDGNENDAQPWVSNNQGKPYFYWQDISVSNETPVKQDFNKHSIDGYIANPGAIVIANRNYRYKKLNSTYWSYLTIGSKEDLNSLFKLITEIISNSEYIIQAYIRDDSNNKYYGDAVYLDNRENTLPVELLDFTAKSDELYTELEWTTAAEINNDFFTIEMSYDTKNWNIIDEINGNGTCNYQNNYSILTDNKNTIVYYRLSQTDFDGTNEILKTIAVEPSELKTTEISIYPNPASDYITINNYIEGIVSIFNTSGQIVLETQIIDNNNTIDITGLDSGNYIIRFDNKESKTISVVR